MGCPTYSISKNAYFKTWGGPHVTLGGFVSSKADQLNPLVSDLRKIDPSNWQISNLNNITTKQDNNLVRAHFQSSLLDKGKKLLKKHQWKKIKEDWHLTLGYQKDHSAKTKSEMLNYLSTSNWEWVIALKDKKGDISWAPIWSSFK